MENFEEISTGLKKKHKNDIVLPCTILKVLCSLILVVQRHSAVLCFTLLYLLQTHHAGDENVRANKNKQCLPGLYLHTYTYTRVCVRV